MGTTKGKIKAISISEKKGTQKANVDKAEFKCDFGIVGDAHAGDWHRQVSLLAVESIAKMVAKGADVRPGDFAENITTEDLDFSMLGLGTKLRLGPTVELELTQFGKKCHSRCQIYNQVGDCVMPREGVFAKVTKEGSISVGDTIGVVSSND
ncbi:MAG: MOSC domain-containing protein [Phycisphaerales bacterium]|nr:MAG: MOSC domain-containing protein [Phycisphaerales bacterium]